MEANKEITRENYKAYVFEKMPKSSHWKNMIWDASVLASATLVFIAAMMTGFGVYDVIGRFAGAGSTIPITGFSNAVVSPALEFRAEGYVYGVGAKMFLVAGPVIVNGVTISVIVALLTLLFGG